MKFKLVLLHCFLLGISMGTATANSGSIDEADSSLNSLPFEWPEENIPDYEPSKENRAKILQALSPDIPPPSVSEDDEISFEEAMTATNEINGTLEALKEFLEILALVTQTTTAEEAKYAPENFDQKIENLCDNVQQELQQYGEKLFNIQSRVDDAVYNLNEKIVADPKDSDNRYNLLAEFSIVQKTLDEQMETLDNLTSFFQDWQTSDKIISETLSSSLDDIVQVFINSNLPPFNTDEDYPDENEEDQYYSNYNFTENLGLSDTDDEFPVEETGNNNDDVSYESLTTDSHPQTDNAPPDKFVVDPNEEIKVTTDDGEADEDEENKNFGELLNSNRDNDTYDKTVVNEAVKPDSSSSSEDNSESFSNALNTKETDQNIEDEDQIVEPDSKEEDGYAEYPEEGDDYDIMKHYQDEQRAATADNHNTDDNQYGDEMSQSDPDSIEDAYYRGIESERDSDNAIDNITPGPRPWKNENSIDKFSPSNEETSSKGGGPTPWTNDFSSPSNNNDDEASKNLGIFDFSNFSNKPESTDNSLSVKNADQDNIERNTTWPTGTTNAPSTFEKTSPSFHNTNDTFKPRPYKFYLDLLNHMPTTILPDPTTYSNELTASNKGTTSDYNWFSEEYPEIEEEYLENEEEFPENEEELPKNKEELPENEEEPSLGDYYSPIEKETESTNDREYDPQKQIIKKESTTVFDPPLVVVQDKDFARRLALIIVVSGAGTALLVAVTILVVLMIRKSPRLSLTMERVPYQTMDNNEVCEKKPLPAEGNNKIYAIDV